MLFICVAKLSNLFYKKRLLSNRDLGMPKENKKKRMDYKKAKKISF
jgi:hypothetical protein